MEEKEILIISLDSGLEFAKRFMKEIVVASPPHIKVRFCEGQEVKFSNGEFKYVLEESVRGKDVYVVQLFDDPNSKNTINDNLLSVTGAINAAKFGDALSIKAILPHFPYARQDKLLAREPLMAQIVGRLLEMAGAKQVITLDIHSQAIKGYFYNIDMISLFPTKLICSYLQKNVHFDNLCVVSPDVGSSKRSSYYARVLESDLAIIDKTRDYSLKGGGRIVSTRLVGNVEGRDVLITDDMLATGSTLVSACSLLKEQGAKDIYLSISLPYFTSKAYERFDELYEKGYFKKLVGTDAVFWGEDFKKQHPWYEEISVAKLFSDVVLALTQRQSVGKLL